LMPACLIIVSVSWPWLVGSGKFGKPCLRTQAANASSPSVRAFCCAGLGR
jgi:hypothetical protein